MGYELSKPMLRAELEADLKRCALAVSIVSCVATVYTIHAHYPCTAHLPCTLSMCLHSILLSIAGSVKEGSQKKVQYALHQSSCIDGAL